MCFFCNFLDEEKSSDILMELWDSAQPRHCELLQLSSEVTHLNCKWMSDRNVFSRLLDAAGEDALKCCRACQPCSLRLLWQPHPDALSVIQVEQVPPTTCAQGAARSALCDRHCALCAASGHSAWPSTCRDWWPPSYSTRWCSGSASGLPSNPNVMKTGRRQTMRTWPCWGTERSALSSASSPQPVSLFLCSSCELQVRCCLLLDS